MRLNVRQLEAFKAVMDKGTVSAAARALNVSQPAITKSIRLLEQQLNLRLFVRCEGRLVPSLEAKCLIGSVTKAFDDFAIVSELARQLCKADAGNFRIAATFGHSQAFLPEAVSAFSKSHPAVDFRVLTLRPDQIVELVAEHEVDLGVVYQPVDHRFREIPLCETDVVCVVPRHHRLATFDTVSPSDFSEEKVISYVEQSHTGQLLKQRCEQAKVPGRFR
jgi:DNA-binding transcriptional LysR family regulator